MILIFKAKIKLEKKYGMPSRKDLPSNYSMLILGIKLWPLVRILPTYRKQVYSCIYAEDLLWEYSD